MKDLLSVVIPAYNEELRISSTLERLCGYLRDNSWEFEVIVVDDGSSDSTVSIVENLSRKYGNIRLIQYSKNAGKGHAIRTGVLSSRGSLLLMCDADLSTPIEEIEKLTPFIRSGFDIAIGSRGLMESDLVVRQPWYREIMGKVFNVFVKIMVIRGLKDTQCGFKLFNGNVSRRLFGKTCIKGFSFDVEVLFLARQEGYKIKEVPIRWLNSPMSKVKITRDPLKMFLDLLKIRTYWLLGKYNKPV
ncbi:MAG TPA: glycosyl transferase [Nitrospiraceae bacterium]|nr:glycosyl transferase [Nitrospiraceae bacterium]